MGTAGRPKRSQSQREPTPVKHPLSRLKPQVDDQQVERRDGDLQPQHHCELVQPQEEGEPEREQELKPVDGAAACEDPYSHRHPQPPRCGMLRLERLPPSAQTGVILRDK